MTTQEPVIVRVEDHVGWLLLNRPAKANAYTDAMVATMSEALAAFAADPDVGAVVIASAVSGRFCSGADLNEIRNRRPEDGFAIPSLALFDQIEALPQPTLAAVGGPAIAGGLEMALACDVRIATASARFSLPETNLGIMPAAGATWRLPRAIGQSAARDIILFGRELDGKEALALGLVAELVDPKALHERAHARARCAASRDPLATRLAKEALRRSTAEQTGRDFVEAAQSQLYGRPGKGEKK
jgi:enoyl-CoA hydratase